MTLVADGNKIELPENCQGVIFMNIASYGGGASLLPRGRNELQTFFDKLMEDDWESDDDTSWREAPEGGGCEVHMAESSMQDGLLDVVALRGIVHLGQLQVGMGQAVQLCQCKQAVVVTSQKLPMHVDGEPWGQKPCEVVISAQKEKACMLRRTVSSGGELAQEFLRLLDWGEARGIMTDAGKHVLLEELSRRVESSHPGLGGKVPSSHNMAALSGSKRRRKT
jgi:diacylglycerol kinase (ATP)